MNNSANATLLPTEADPDSHFPNRYGPSRAEDTTAEEVLSATVVPLRQRNNRTVVWSITIDGQPRDTSKPIILASYQDGEFWFSENISLNIVGTGRSPDEATHDATQHIAHLYLHYHALQDSEVVGDAVRLKKTYKALLLPK